MPNQRRADWTSRGVAMPDELWRALQAARVTEQLPSVGAVIRAACREYVAIYGDAMPAVPQEGDHMVAQMGDGRVYTRRVGIDTDWTDVSPAPDRTPH